MSYIGFGIVHSQQPFTIDEFTGDGVTTVFTLSTPKPIISRAILVTIDGVVQDPGALNSYDLDANGDIEFSEAPENLASIRVLHLGRKYDLAVPMDGSVTPDKIAPDANGDFHFDGNTLYIDYFNNRIGVNTSTPQYTLDVVGDIHASGNITADGNITLGDADTDSITLNADITSHIIPDADATYDLGSATKHWNTVYTHEISFDSTTVSTPTEGQLVWNANDGTLDLGMVNSNVVLQIGQETLIYGRNISGATLTNGTVVKVVGASGDKITVNVADKSTETTSATTIGVVTEDINNNSSGYITTQGLVRDLDTSAFGEGDAIYLGATGTFTNIPPVSPDHLVMVGWVTRVHATEGMIYVYVRNGWELGELHDVNLTVAPTDGQSIIWDSATSTWIAGDSFNQADFDTAIAGVSIGDLSDVDITSTAPTNEQVLVWDAVGGKFIPGDAAADFTDLTGQIAASQIPNDIITTAMMNYSVNVFSQEFTADGLTDTFTLTSDPGSKNAIQVFVDGVPQRASNYTVVGTTLTLGGTPSNGQLVEIRGYGVALPVGTVADNSITGAKLQDNTIGLNKIAPGDYYAADTFTGDGNTASYTLSTDPGSPWAITVYVAGVWQKPIENYGVVGTTLTFTSNVPNGEEIYVRYYGVALAVGTVADDSITGAKIQDGSITANKIAASEYVTQGFTGDGLTASFTLSTDPGSQNALLVLVDNVLQTPVTNYTVSGTTLTFTSAPDNLSDIFVRFVGLPHPVATVADSAITTAKLQDNSVTNAKLNLTYTSNQYTGDGSTTDYTIAAGHTVNSLLLILDGSILPPSDYTVAGTTLTFATPPLLNQSIDIRYMPV